MKQTIKILTVIIFAYAGTSEIFAQNELEMQKIYADSLFEAGNYFDAITEYKRLLFFDGRKMYGFYGNFMIGLAYKYGGFYENSIKHFKLAESFSPMPSEKYRILEQIARVNILRGTTEVALEILNNLERELTDLQLKNRIRYWKGWAFMFSDDWENALKEFNKINSGKELAKICNDVINRKYSVTFARLISYILPGAGQFYTGHYISGLMSLGMNVLWGYFTVQAFIADRVFDGIVIGNLLWFRFYRGNYQNAEKFARQKNIKIANEALKKIQIEYKGEKP